MTKSQRKEQHLALQETFGFLLWDAHRAMTQEFSLRIAAHRLSIGIFPFLRALWEGDGITLSELADRVRMRGPTAVGAIRKLEGSGLVRRVGDPKDGRKTKLFLTPKGRELFLAALPEVESVRRMMLADFSDAEEALFKQMLQRVRANIAVQRPSRAAKTSLLPGSRIGGHSNPRGNSSTRPARSRSAT